MYNFCIIHPKTPKWDRCTWHVLQEFMEDFFQQHATIPAEMLGDAMHLLNMNPTADEAFSAICGAGPQF